MLIETGLAAAVIAALELVTMGCLDIVKAKLGKPHFHHRGFKGLLRGQASVKKYGPRHQGIILSTAPLEAALNYIWLIGVGTSFVRNWTSMVYVQAGCQLPGAGYFSLGISTVFTGPNVPLNFFINGLTSRPCARVGGNEVIIANGCQATITYTAKFIPFQGDPANEGPVTTWLETDDGRKFNVGEAWKDPKTGEILAAGGMSNFHAGILGERTVKVMFQVASGIMGCSDGTIHVSAYGKPIHLIPRGCVPKPNDTFP
jgi:hypothetical protein